MISVSCTHVPSVGRSASQMLHSCIGFESAAPNIDDIMRALEIEGLQIEQYMRELGPGQRELSVCHVDALRAADNVLTEALSPTLATAYIAVKRLESAYFADKSPEEEAGQHFYKY